MQLRFFRVPVHDGGEAAEDLNAFLRSHRIISVDREFVASGSDSGWAICVSYVDGRARGSSGKKGGVDYREILSAEDFAVYARLRELRKRLAREENVPAYALFTNEQLATMVRERASSLADLSGISGVGAARIDKHGAVFLEVLQEAFQGQPQTDGGEADAA